MAPLFLRRFQLNANFGPQVFDTSSKILQESIDVEDKNWIEGTSFSSLVLVTRVEKCVDTYRFFEENAKDIYRGEFES